MRLTSPLKWILIVVAACVVLALLANLVNFVFGYGAIALVVLLIAYFVWRWAGARQATRRDAASARRGEHRAKRELRKLEKRLPR